MLRCVSPKLRTDDERIATICRQDLSKEDFAHPTAIIGSRIDQIDPRVHGGSDRIERLCNVELTELCADRRGPKSQRGHLDRSATELAFFQGQNHGLQIPVRRISPTR